MFLSVCIFSRVASAGGVFDELSSAGKDKYVHFATGVAVSHLSYPFSKKYFKKENRAVLSSILLVALVSAGKELHDRNKTGFNTDDLTAGILGGCTILAVKF